MLKRGGKFNSLLSISALTSSLLTTLVTGSSASTVRFLAGIGMSFLSESSDGNVDNSAEGLALVTVTFVDSTLE